MLQCVPPFLSQKIVEHLMKNYIKAFLATGIGMAMMKIVADPEKLSVNKDTKYFSPNTREYFLPQADKTSSCPASMSSSSLMLSVGSSEDETK